MANLDFQEAELVLYTDKQVLSQGLIGYFNNGGHHNVLRYVEVLRKRNNELDQEVIALFLMSLVAVVDYFNYRFVDLPECREIYLKSEKVLKENEKKYAALAKKFMKSYRLTDYITKLEDSIAR